MSLSLVDDISQATKCLLASNPRWRLASCLGRAGGCLAVHSCSLCSGMSVEGTFLLQSGQAVVACQPTSMGGGEIQQVEEEGEREPLQLTEIRALAPCPEDFPLLPSHLTSFFLLLAGSPDSERDLPQ